MHTPDTVTIQNVITALLAAQEPCTLDQICEEIRVLQCMRRNDVLPAAINAIAALQQAGKICAYEQPPLDDPLEYAWLLSEEA